MKVLSTIRTRIICHFATFVTNFEHCHRKRRLPAAEFHHIGDEEGDDATGSRLQDQANITAKEVNANEAIVQLLESQQDPKKREDSVLHIDQCKGAAHFRRWKLDMKAKLARASSDTDACYAWLDEIDRVSQASDLRNPTKFRSFDDKLALACKKIATGKAAREIKRVELELERVDKLMGGR